MIGVLSKLGQNVLVGHIWGVYFTDGSVNYQLSAISDVLLDPQTVAEKISLDLHYIVMAIKCTQFQNMNKKVFHNTNRF